MQRKPCLPKITRPMIGWCRWRAGETGIGACDKKEARQIRDVLVYYRKLLLEKNVYILDIFTRMIETINVQRIRPAKWKRYLKKSLFHKILREEYLFA